MDFNFGPPVPFFAGISNAQQFAYQAPAMVPMDHMSSPLLFPPQSSFLGPAFPNTSPILFPNPTLNVTTPTALSSEQPTNAVTTTVQPTNPADIDTWIMPVQIELTNALLVSTEIHTLCRNIVSTLVGTLGLYIGEIYAFENGPDEDPTCTETFPNGTTLLQNLGIQTRSMVEKGAKDCKTVCYTEITPQSLAIYVLVLPLALASETKAVLVLSSFLNFTPLQLKFLRQASKPMCTAIQSAFYDSEKQRELDSMNKKLQTLQAHTQKLAKEEHTLRMINRSLHTLLSSPSETGFAAVSLQGSILFCNDSVEFVCGHKRNQLVGASPLAVHSKRELYSKAGVAYPPDEEPDSFLVSTKDKRIRQQLLESLHSGARNGKTERGLYTIMSRDGYIYCVDMSVSPMYTGDSIAGLLVVAQVVGSRTKVN